jgi:hypothetical protein
MIVEPFRKGIEWSERQWSGHCLSALCWRLRLLEEWVVDAAAATAATATATATAVTVWAVGTGRILGVTVLIVSDRASGISVLTSVYQQNVCAETEARCLRTWRNQEECGGKNPRERGKKHFLEHLFTSSEK